MNLKALSNYNNDTDTRFGDCILVYDESTLVVYDCGHQKHAENVMHFLEENPTINSVNIVVSHNDSDHTAGVCDLIEALAAGKQYYVKIYTHQLLKYADDILEIINDGRRTHDSVKKAILDEFDNIKAIIDKAQENNFDTIEALVKTAVGPCEIVGPTADEFIQTAAKAIDDRESNKIGAGHIEETVMNAASIQLKGTIDISEKMLLCGDATPDFIKDISKYDIIQLPHHGKLENAQDIFDKLNGDSYKKKYLISDNTGSGETSGGSDKLVQYIKEEKYNQDLFFNTKNGPVSLNTSKETKSTGDPVNTNKERRYLGDLDCIKENFEKRG